MKIQNCLDNLRIDRWLWAARFYKTRSIALQQINKGKVWINGNRIKPSRRVKIGDDLIVSIGPYSWEITVLKIDSKRGPSNVAQKLYKEKDSSRVTRQIISTQIRQEQIFTTTKGRPTKKNRRSLNRFKYEQFE